MPLYEYQCPQCGRFELIQKFSDPVLASCPTCGSDVQKLLSAPAIQFKGSGWYITDYARKSAGGAKGESAAGDSGSKGETAKSGDSSTAGSTSSSSSAGSGSSTSTGSSSTTK